MIGGLSHYLKGLFITGGLSENPPSQSTLEKNVTP